MKALISIDYTHDFVHTDGKLTAGIPAQNILPAMLEITDTFVKNNDLVVYAIDRHEENDRYHPESKLFPPIIFRVRKVANFLILTSNNLKVLILVSKSFI